MANVMRKILGRVIPKTLFNELKKYHDKKLLKEWNINCNPVPAPHIVKQNIIIEYQEKFRYSILIETGTFMGDMVEAQKRRFAKIISIELDYKLFKKAQNRFKSDKNVSIVQGDSGKVLSGILKNVDEPVIFWLDGHYSAGITAKGDKECPIFEELDSIFKEKQLNQVLLIDDARCFDGTGDYPTINQLTKYIKKYNEKYMFELKHDVLRYAI